LGREYWISCAGRNPFLPEVRPGRKMLALKVMNSTKPTLIQLDPSSRGAKRRGDLFALAGFIAAIPVRSRLTPK